MVKGSLSTRNLAPQVLHSLYPLSVLWPPPIKVLILPS